MKLQRAHQQQQMVLRKYQEKITKMKALEDTVRQQERVSRAQVHGRVRGGHPAGCPTVLCPSSMLGQHALCS